MFDSYFFKEDPTKVYSAEPDKFRKKTFTLACIHVSLRATIRELYEQDFFVELDTKVTVINKVGDISDNDKNEQKYQLQIELYRVILFFV